MPKTVAKPSPVPADPFGGKERLENSGLDRLIHAATIVADGQQDIGAGPVDSGDPSSWSALSATFWVVMVSLPPHGMACTGIDGQVEKHLFHLTGVRPDVRQRGVLERLQFDIFTNQAA